MEYLSAQPAHHVEAGKIIVKFNPDAVQSFEKKPETINRTSTDTSALSIGIKSFDVINRRYRATNMRRVFPDAGEYEAKHRKYGLHLWYEITISDNENPETAAADYNKDANVLISEPDYKIRRCAMPTVLLSNDELPDDSYFEKQWNFNNMGQSGGTPGVDIKMLEAWEKVKTLGVKNTNVIVAVTDGGINYDHEDLNANMWINEVEYIGYSGIDDDKNGYVDDIYGHNFVSRSGKINPEDHATHVAGVIAAVTNNGKGVAGISGNRNDGYGIKIMNVQILDGNQGVSNIGPAFTYAADNGAVISQNSWGYENPNVNSEKDLAAINYFINEAGRDKDGNPRPGTPMVGGIVIFAAGNDGKDNKWYPAYYDNVIAVAAIDHFGKLASYSNFGNWIDISAPGGHIKRINSTTIDSIGGIYSTSYKADNKNYYEYMQGTSMACPHVSGVAALILSVYGNESYTPDMLRSKLLCSATSLDEFDPDNASKAGAGLLNASAALEPVVNTRLQITDLTANAINAVSCKLKWTVSQADINYELNYYSLALTDKIITENNFDLYSRNPVSPQKTDEDRELIVDGLSPETTYYMAIRNVGNCNSSPISNVVTFSTFQNRSPELIRIIPDTTIIPSKTPIYIDLSKYFADPEGETMTFTAQNNYSDIVSAEIQNNFLTITPLRHGYATIQTVATDPHQAQAETSFNITVEQKYSPAKTEQLLIYPNPYPSPETDLLWYSFIIDDDFSSITICITDLSGKIMLQKEIKELSNDTIHYDNFNSHNSNIINWVSGIYLIYYIKDGKVIDSKKLLKL